MTSRREDQEKAVEYRGSFLLEWLGVMEMATDVLVSAPALLSTNVPPLWVHIMGIISSQSLSHGNLKPYPAHHLQ